VGAQRIDHLAGDRCLAIPAVGVGQDFRRHEAAKLVSRRALATTVSSSFMPA